MGVEQGIGVILNDGGDDTAIYSENTLATDNEPTRFVINKIGDDPDEWELYKNGDEIEFSVEASDADSFDELPTPVRLFDWG